LLHRRLWRPSPLLRRLWRSSPLLRHPRRRVRYKEGLDSWRRVELGAENTQPDISPVEPIL
jgi:hypothetical protein